MEPLVDGGLRVDGVLVPESESSPVPTWEQVRAVIQGGPEGDRVDLLVTGVASHAEHPWTRELAARAAGPVFSLDLDWDFGAHEDVQAGFCNGIRFVGARVGDSLLALAGYRVCT